MQQYLNLLRDVLDNGRETVADIERTKTGTIGVFGRQVRYHLPDGLPVVTTKKLHLKAVIHELLWFLKGHTNIAYLKENDVSIWDEWADGEGDLGPVYGEMWRSWPTANGSTIDQLAENIRDLREDPRSRRILTVSWNPEFLPLRGVPPKEQAKHGRQALPPCHCLFQFYAVPLTVQERYRELRKRPNAPLLRLDNENDRDNHTLLDAHSAPKYGLSCQLYQRSGDIFLGVPFNITSYALLVCMMAQVVGMVPWDFVHTFGDLHLYKNHMTQARIQLGREPRPLPTVRFKRLVESIDEFEYGDIVIENYKPDLPILAPVAI